MAQHYGYAGQPPYQQPGYQNQNGGNPYQQGPPYQHGAPYEHGPPYHQPPPAGFNPQVFVPPPPMHPGSDAYVEGGDVKSDFGFNSASVRAAFVRKVFILVGIMLTVVTLMTAIPFVHQETMTFVRSTPSLYFGSYVIFMVIYFTLMCCEGVRRSFPGNLIALSILTLAIGYMTMIFCSYHRITSVLLCLTITVVCSAGIIIFSSQTKYDLTSMYGILFIVSLVLLVFSIVAVIAVFAFHVRWLYTVYAGLSALFFMVYLAVDVQTIMGGRKYEISPEDYIFAAIQVFVDIVYIFWMLLFSSNK
ncbi:Inhibitor of apoptosis-promoting Bax1 family protein [Acanthocheilonema viteae]